MVEIPLLSILIFLPLISCLFVLIAKSDELQNARLSALGGSFITLLSSLGLFFLFDFEKSEVCLIEEHIWLSSYGINFKLGVDRFSLFFILMIASISFLSILWIFTKSIRKTKHFFISILLFEAFAIGAFTSFDLFVLLFFIEATMLPLFIMIHTAGKGHFKGAVAQFFVYGMAGAICVMTAMLLIYNEKGSSDILELYSRGSIESPLAFWLLLLGIGFKLPLFPLHYWLPKVHVESPTVCSVFLASIVLKFSSLLALRLLLPLFEKEISEFSSIIGAVCSLGLLISCSHLFFQDDLKKFFAYFSIFHMNLFFLILLSHIGEKFFVFSVLYHSFIMPALFFISDIIKMIFKTRSITDLQKMEVYLIKVKRLMLMGVLCLIGVPLSWGFITEIFAVISASHISKICLGIVVITLFASSARAFYVYQTIFGSWKKDTINSIELSNLFNWSRNLVFYVFFAIIVFTGIFAGYLL